MGPETSRLDDYAEHLLDIVDERVDERALPEVSEFLGKKVHSIDEAYDLAADGEDMRQINEIFRCVAYDIAEEDMSIWAEEAAEARYEYFHN